MYETFLAEKVLLDAEPPASPKLEVEAVDATKDETLELASLSNVQGVNALASDQRLEFDASLTILFGQNGSGKTGYARVLKRISAARAATEILPNARLTYRKPPPPPSADIVFRVAGEERTTRWNNEAGLAPFTRISVFDAGAASLHVDSELGYVYTPAELALFAHVAAGLQGIQRRISSEVASLADDSNPLLSQFARETRIYTLIETLGAATDIGELQAAAVVDEGAEVACEQLVEEINKLRSNALGALLANAQQSERDLRRLSSLVTAVKGFSARRYEQAVTATQHAENRLAEAREQLFAEDELPGPPDDEWQQFISAGDTYRGHLGRNHYPQESDSCLYCMQALSPAAVALLTRYRTFLDETLAQQVSTARKELAEARLTLDEAEVARVKEYVTNLASEIETPSWVVLAERLLVHATAAMSETNLGHALSCAGLSTDASALSTEVGAAVEAAAKSVEQLKSESADTATLLATKESELAELRARLDLKKNLSMAVEYVRRAKRAQLLTQLSRAISNGAATRLTVQSNLASEDLANRDFERLFVEECGYLEAPKVALVFQGRSGLAQRKKVVANYRPSAVLSEGEQKVLALADFLAESRMRGVTAPLVFDDPVTSLDYRRLDQVAARIQNLSETHQVIVLTHNVMFASAIISSRQNKRLRVKIYEVRDGGDQKGILAPDVEPQFDSPNDIGKRINVKLEGIPRADPVAQDALIKEAYDPIRAWCEAFVEQNLLQNVTQRYRHNIMMTRLSKIDSTRFDAAVSVIEPLFARACDRMTGHSHPAERLSTKPTVAEVQEDWQKAKAARAAYLAD